MTLPYPDLPDVQIPESKFPTYQIINSYLAKFLDNDLAITGDIFTLDGNLATVSDDLDALELDVSALDGNLATVSDDLDALESTVGGLGWSVGAIDVTPEHGMTLSNNVTDADHDIDIVSGIRYSLDYTTRGTLTSTLTKQIDATWVAGNNAGGMASGVSLSIDTQYYTHALIKSDGSVDVGFDTSLTASNLITDANVISSGYTKYRYIGPILTDGSKNIINGSMNE